MSAPRPGKCADNWAYRPTEHHWAAAWPTILADTARILTRTTDLGIMVGGPHGHGAPILDTHRGIAFNGTGGDHAQALRLAAPHRNPYPSPCGIPAPATGLCQTGRRPYDVAVACVLLRCHLLLGDDFLLSTDGDWDLEWAIGVRIGQPSPRQLVGALFGPAPARSPLRSLR
jgi:hypothetical protein